MGVTQYYNTLTRYWLQLDLYEVYSWKCVDDSALYKKIVEQKRTVRFLLGLNRDLDEVRGRVMGIKPFLNLREAFAEVRREESRKRLMLTESKPGVEVSALFTHNSSQPNRFGKGRPWCDHCKKLGHVKATCWKLHGKPVDWKPSNTRVERETRANNATTTEISTEGSGFGEVIGSAEMHDGLYLLKGNNLFSRQVHSPGLGPTSNSVKCFPNSVSFSNLVSVESQVMLWHLRLGHPNFDYIGKLFPHLFINKSSSFYQCEFCQLAKHTRSIYPSLQYKPSSPFSIIHSDIWGPARIKNINGARWFVTFIDDL
ncbi:uncharacterized protein [Primulina eburnea]|uniref:uncharacterized protein n=1 Tax=Primulina eburnea TaxID=1245227 RepID=UPI003C6BFBA7